MSQTNITVSHAWSAFRRSVGFDLQGSMCSLEFKRLGTHPAEDSGELAPFWIGTRLPALVCYRQGKVAW